MDNVICPGCNGYGILGASEIPNEDGTTYIEVDKCPTCYGSGIATDDEATEFDEFCKEIDNAT